MNALREFVGMIVEVARTFDEWLTPDVVALLIERYAKKSDVLGTLSWQYTNKLGPRTWGEYQPFALTLYVAKAKTRDMFKQQVQTILHEIQHWNQHVDVVSRAPTNTSNLNLRQMFSAGYSAESRAKGYRNNRFEVDARAFAAEHLEEAMDRLSKHYGGKIEGTNIDDVVEELFDEYAESSEPISRLQIGSALRDHDLNTPNNMRSVVDKLHALDVPVR